MIGFFVSLFESLGSQEESFSFLDIQSICLCNKLGLAEGWSVRFEHEGFSSLPHGAILLKTDLRDIVKITLNPEMDYEQFFTKTEAKECDCSNHIRVTLAVITLLCLIVDCVSSCKTKRRMNAIEAENQTLKSIIFKSVDRALVNLIKPDEVHED
jgi:hypothetical protein